MREKGKPESRNNRVGICEPTSILLLFAINLHMYSPLISICPLLASIALPLTPFDRGRGEGGGGRGRSGKAARFPGPGTLQATGGRFWEPTDGSQTREKNPDERGGRRQAGRRHRSTKSGFRFRSMLQHPRPRRDHDVVQENLVPRLWWRNGQSMAERGTTQPQQHGPEVDGSVGT